MNDGVLDAFRHNAWATRELLGFCAAMPDEQLKTPGAGAHGSILETLNHVLEADSYYYWLLTGERLKWDWELDGTAGIARLQQTAADLEALWLRFLHTPFDAEAEVSRPSSPGGIRTERLCTVIAQAIHHPNVHREQVNMLLTVQGIQPPDLDVWVYDRLVLRRSNPGPNLRNADSENAQNSP